MLSVGHLLSSSLPPRPIEPSQGRVLGQGDDALAGEGFGQAVAVALGLDEVRMVHEPIDAGGRDGLGHDRVKAGRVNIAGHGDGTPFMRHR